MNGSNSKFVKDKIRKHILSQYNAKDYGVRTRIDALKMELNSVRESRDSDYNAGTRLVNGGRYNIYHADVHKFLKSLNLKGSDKKYTPQEEWALYAHLIGRETNNLVNKRITSIRKKKKF